MANISIIIPCYNVEKCIDQCMQSIVEQTIGIKNLEIILVNDASTDATLQKLQQWEKKYPDEIAVVTYDENLRQGGARNIGLRYAASEWIGFVDADDWIEKDMYQRLYEKAQTGKFDVVRGKLVRDEDYGRKKGTEVNCEDQEYYFKKYGDYYLGKVEKAGVNGEYGGIVTGIYKRSIILENEIFFPEKLAYEDNYWDAVLRYYTGSCCILDTVVYHYVTNPESTVTGQNKMYHLDRLKIELMKLIRYKEMGIFDREPFYQQIEADFIQMYYLNTLFILFTRFDQIPDVVNQMRRTVCTYFPDWSENPYIQTLDFLQAPLLELLRIERDMTYEEIEEIRRLYVSAWAECNGIRF